jgi:hypothetical protein
MSNEDLGMLRKVVSEKNWSSACTTGTMQQQQQQRNSHGDLKPLHPCRQGSVKNLNMVQECNSYGDLKPLHPCRQGSVKNLYMVQECKKEVWDQLPTTIETYY